MNLINNKFLVNPYLNYAGNCRQNYKLYFIKN